MRDATMSKFRPTHRVRERGTEAWIEVRADGIEPQTYYDRDGKTIYAGIWFQNMEVERFTPRPELTNEMVGRAEAHLREWYEHDGNLRWIVPTEVLRAALEEALVGGTK